MKKIGWAVIKVLVGLVVLCAVCSAAVGMIYGIGKFMLFVTHSPVTYNIGECFALGIVGLLSFIGIGTVLVSAWFLGELIVRKIKGGD